ncbi:Protein eva-1 like C, partial [Pseudolycoriella hygida]
SKEYTICPLQRLNKSTEFKDEALLHICQLPETSKYSLLQTAIETCQKKTMCQFVAAPKSLEGNPCPDVRRLISYAYKCRPYEFRSKTACENEIIQLTCSPYWRITIYTCLVSYANERVMQMCHGKRRCIISADATTFGEPCKPESRMYLKIVYTCVPKQILKEVYDFTMETDEPLVYSSTEPNVIYHDDQFFRESEAIPPAPKVYGGLANVGSVNTTIGQGIKHSNEGVDETIFEESAGLFYIYIALTATVLILMVLIIIVIGRIVLLRRNSTANAKLHECTSVRPTSTKEIKSDDVISLDSDFNSTDHADISNVHRDGKLFGSTYIPSSYSNLDPDNLSFKLNPATSVPSCQTSVVDYPPMYRTSTFQRNHRSDNQSVATIVPNHTSYLYNDQSINQTTTNFNEFYLG